MKNHPKTVAELTIDAEVSVKAGKNGINVVVRDLTKNDEDKYTVTCEISSDALHRMLPIWRQLGWQMAHQLGEKLPIWMVRYSPGVEVVVDFRVCDSRAA